MLHVNANHSAVVSGFPTSIKPVQAGRNILAFTERGDSNKRSRGEDDGGDMQPNLWGPTEQEGVCAGRLIRAPQLELWSDLCGLTCCLAEPFPERLESARL